MEIESKPSLYDRLGGVYKRIDTILAVPDRGNR
jgi:hypothetical protein